MATAQNSYFLALAKSMESIAQSERGVILYPHDKIEVLASTLQALLMTLGGAQPTSTAMPPEVGIIGLSDLVQVSQQKPNLAWAAFQPAFTFGTVQPGTVSGVKADGSLATTVVYANSFAFPTATLYVVACIKNAYQSNPWQLTIQTTSYTTTGFALNVAGAPASSTVAVDYIAVGN